MDETRIKKILFQVAENFIQGNDQQVEVLWKKIYPLYSITSRPDLYKSDEIEDLYTLVYKALAYKNFSEPIVSKEELFQYINEINSDF